MSASHHVFQHQVESVTAHTDAGQLSDEQGGDRELQGGHEEVLLAQ